MKRYDQKILFTALAFITVMLKGKATAQQDSDKVFKLAGFIDDFCTKAVTDSYEKISVADAAGCDAAINKHIQELRERQQTRLPEDKDTLANFYKRLLERKAERVVRDVYEVETAEHLSDLVLSYLDEEIENQGALS